MKQIKPILYISIIATLYSCSSESIKDKINKAGNIAGQATGEFVQGATDGVAKAFDVKTEVQPELFSQGLEFGKSSVMSDTGATDNLLIVYVVFNKDFSGNLTAKAFDDQLLEIGRTTSKVMGKMGEARYVEFHFEKFTNIDSKNKLTIEQSKISVK